MKMKTNEPLQHIPRSRSLTKTGFEKIVQKVVFFGIVFCIAFGAELGHIFIKFLKMFNVFGIDFLVMFFMCLCSFFL